MKLYKVTFHGKPNRYGSTIKEKFFLANNEEQINECLRILSLALEDIEDLKVIHKNITIPTESLKK